MIYLDNSASTFVKPKEVIKAVNDSLMHYGANPGRSGHKASIRSAMEVELTREKLANMFKNNASNVIFTNNCSDALNLAILGSAKKGGHVICTENEHNSVLRPLEHLKEEGIIEYSVAYQSNKVGIKVEDIKPLIRDNTYLVICNHISNVNGDKADIDAIGKLCNECGILFLVDGAQSAGHEDIDMTASHINMLTIAGHKGFYAPQSIGALLLNGEVELSPIRFGGTGTNSLELFQPKELPERFECGTLSTPLIMGLSAGIDFVNNNYNEIRYRLDDLTTYLNYELSKLPVITYTQPENAHGVLAFNIENVHSSDFANYLDEKWNICVRGGYHCAPLKHTALGTIDQGTVRISISYFNNFTDIQRLLLAIKSFLKKQN